MASASSSPLGAGGASRGRVQLERSLHASMLDSPLRATASPRLAQLHDEHEKERLRRDAEDERVRRVDAERELEAALERERKLRDEVARLELELQEARRERERVAGEARERAAPEGVPDVHALLAATRALPGAAERFGEDAPPVPRDDDEFLAYLGDFQTRVERLVAK